jgi:hypothetical protein
MAIGSFKLDKIFIIHIPLLVIIFRHSSQKALLSKNTKVGGCGIAKKTKCVVVSTQAQRFGGKQQKMTGLESCSALLLGFLTG